MLEETMFMPSCSDVLIDESVSARRIFYRLGESELFTYANNNTTTNGQKLVNVIPKMCVENQGFIHIPYSSLEKEVQYELFEGPRYKLTCKKTIRAMIEAGIIDLVYSEEYKIPTCIPYIIQGSDASAKIIVNISDFVTMNNFGKFTISNPRNYNALMAIIFAAAVSIKYVKSGAQSLPADLADGAVMIHATMLERCINSIVHMDPVMKDKVRYLATEFALIQMYGTDRGQELFFHYRTKYFAKLSNMITDTIDNQFQTDCFDSLSRFVAELARLYPSMKHLTNYLVSEKWIRMYGAATAMSIDYFGYHLYTICMVLFESPLIQRMALEPVMEKNAGAEIYKRMQIMLN